MSVLTQQTDRFKDAEWVPKHNESVVIGGAGGIGSWLAFFLARIGFNISIYDFDIIEEHNLGGQLFQANQVGSYKVDAVRQILANFNGNPPNTFNVPFTLTSPTHHFMFSAFDNMKARKEMFEVWKRSIPNCPVTPIFIDGRLELEQLQIFCVTPEYIDEYQHQHLFDDARVEDAPCTMKQTSHTAAMIASHMTAFFTNHIANIYEGERYRDIPFFYEYVVPISLTTELK
jgi:hypothetical protein